MSYNEKIADRIREMIAETESNIEEKKMFGGLCFMVNDKMCVGVEKERLMVRLDPANYDDVMEKEGCKPMDFTGKVMRGYVFVDMDVLSTKKKLAYWIKLALEYNKVAKASKKNKQEKMTIENLQAICKKLGDVTEDIKWGHDLCFNIGGKMFLVTGPDDVPVSASFKATEETFNELTEREGFIPAPYLARHKWVYVDDISRLSKKEWTQFITQSYDLVKAKLPKKKK